MNGEVQEDFNHIDDDETSEGLLHLRESELSTDEIIQMDVHWTIRREGARNKFYCFWVECKKNYVSKHKSKKYLINDNYFIDVKGGGKGGRPRMAGPTRTRTTTVDENQRNNLRVWSNPVV